jgi:SAM-dependent methyltransferase
MTTYPDSARVLDALARGVCPPDAAFDQFLAEPIRRLSACHWTPLAVAVKAARWFEECRIRTVIDIGSGAGKFCVAAAIASRCHIVGLEHREHLLTSARLLARTFGVEDRTYFIHGALGDVRLPTVDAYYLFNPFEENVLDPRRWIDDSVGLSRQRLTRDLDALHALLARARTGTYVLIYNGFGGSLPASYTRICVDRELPNELCLWRKSASRRIGRSYCSGCSDRAGAAAAFDNVASAGADEPSFAVDGRLFQNGMSSSEGARSAS